MKRKLFFIVGIVMCVCLCACSGRDVGVSESSGSLDSSSQTEELSKESEKLEARVESSSFYSSEETWESDDIEKMELNVYHYDNIPGFSMPDIIPSKIIYHKIMLGEKITITDSEQMGDIMELLDEVKIDSKPIKRDNDEELHQVIEFYQNIEDEEPVFSLFFFEDTMYVETGKGKSDSYSSLNWINRGSDDESKINVQLGKLIDSWASPGTDFSLLQ